MGRVETGREQTAGRRELAVLMGKNGDNDKGSKLEGPGIYRVNLGVCRTAGIRKG